MEKRTVFLFSFILLTLHELWIVESAEQPNIVIIMADDMSLVTRIHAQMQLVNCMRTFMNVLMGMQCRQMVSGSFLTRYWGFDDVSFRGSNRFLTPNIDALAFSGIVLKNLYTPAMCTPSRAALLTGKYPIHTGMHHYVIPNDQPWGLPTNETTMAEIFKQNGYFTSLIGKWHLGMSRKRYTPTYRGFQQHYGYLGAYVDYFDQTLYSPDKNYSRGHDFRDNLRAAHEGAGIYVTDLLTDAAVKLIRGHNTTKQPLFLILSHLAPHSGNEDEPMQAPIEEIKRFSYIKDTDRRVYAAMVSRLDRSVGDVIEALAQNHMLNNTIILFLSDNGGPTIGMHSTGASNWPLRGQKNSPWEGALRSSAAIWSAQFERPGSVWSQRTYIADFLPTLAAAADIESPENINWDGLNLWSALKSSQPPFEREIVHNIDDIFQYVSYSSGKWKYIKGTTERGIYDHWLGSRPSTEIDTRSSHYEQQIRESTVWRVLSGFNSLSSTTNITQLRAEAEVSCQFSYNATSGGRCNPGVWCNPLEAPCLFDIDVDPCEQNNLYEQYKQTPLMERLLAKIEYHRQNMLPPRNKPADPHCDPRLHKNEWTWWEDDANEIAHDSRSSSQELSFSGDSNQI